MSDLMVKIVPFLFGYTLTRLQVFYFVIKCTLHKQEFTSTI